MFLPEYALKAVKVIQNIGYNIYPVGGCVRNFIMETVPDDYDMTTNALPLQTLAAFSAYTTFDAGLKHGTVSVVINGQVIEITTHRIESSYSDNRHPDNVKFTDDLTLDLMRRDFTMNAIAYDPRNGSYIDPFDGVSDIKNKLIRCVGDAEERFVEDGLRILRALRFSSILGFDIEEETKNAIHKMKHLLEGISKERIYTEFTKLLCGMDVRRVLGEYYDVIAVFIPEILPCVGFDQHNMHHCYDVWEHTLVTLESIDADPLLRWTMLCHDLGKPETYSEDDNGGHFYGHYKNSSEISKRILKRLKASNEMTDTVTLLVYHHDSVTPETEKSVRKLVVKLGERNTRLMLKIKFADAAGQAPFQFEERKAYLERLGVILEEVLASECCLSIRDMAVNGHDLFNIGIPKNERMGIIINTLFCEIVEGKLENKKETLLRRASELK